jgi:hypothetical protein
MRREALDSERPADADLLGVVVGLVEELLEFGVSVDRGIDLRAGHAFFDVRVVRYGLESDVL